jgi:PBP1b-binding outer membrane lipoprotein LpoB
MKWIVIVLLLLSGCAGVQGYQSMSPEQLAAMAKMKDATVNCIKGSTVWTGPYFVVMVQLDKGVIPEGGITVDGDCKVSMTNSKVTTTVTTVTTPISK